ncbi:DUF2009 domain-containing protein [Macrococcus capreoli]
MKMKYSELMNLDYKYIFDYYDFPLFFVSMNKDNQLFLNYYIEEVSNEDKWFFSQITKRELIYLLSKKLEVKNLLIKLINDKRMEYLFVNESERDIRFENIDIIDYEELPLEEFYVEYDFVSNSKIEYENEFEVISNELDIVIRDHENSHKVEVDVLTKALITIQDLYTTITQDYKKLSVLALYPSSFGVKLVAEDDLFNSSQETIETVMTMLSSIKNNDINSIKENLLIDKVYTIQALNKARKLANVVNSENISLEIKTIGPKNKSLIINKSDKEKFESLEGIVKEYTPEKEETIKIKGILNSININRNHFSIHGLDDMTYSGKLEKELKDTLTEKHFIIPAPIEVTLLKSEVYDNDKDEYIVKYLMKSFEQSLNLT